MENLIPLIGWHRAGWVVILGPGTTTTIYIAIRDIAEMLSAKPSVQNPIVEFGGEDLSMLNCVAQLQEALERRLRVLHVPLRLFD